MKSIKLLDENTTTKKISVYEVIAQLALTLFSLHLVNEKIIDIWRSLTGH
jgi:hypothetical protein